MIDHDVSDAGVARLSVPKRAAGMRTVLAALTVVCASTLGETAAARTTVTEYTYNPDGALTAVTTQVDAGARETIYLTWDNFVPDASTPASGTVSAGNGTLSAIGSAPGATGATEQFSFDPRDRLLSYAGPPGNETFDYHADGGMSLSSVSSDELRFYYDHSVDAKVTNIHQTGAARWSAYLGRVRYLDDGSEEVLLAPRRKDVACSYAPGQDALQSYVYEPYGASQLEAPPQGTYDLSENPFRFAGEYRDPLWGGIYLRARWYHPEYTVFLSRDPMDELSRYGYTRGNPVMRVDPSGLKFNYMRSIGNPLGRFLKWANKGVGGHFVRLIFAPFLAPLQIVADPPGFWHAVKTNQNGIDVFLALAVVSEVGGGYVDSYFAGRGVSQLRRFLFRATSDAAIGLGQSTAAAASRGFNHFDWNTLVQGAELTTSAIGYRGLTRFNVDKAGGAQTGAGQLANGLDQAPRETYLLSRSGSLDVERSESFDVVGPRDSSNQLNLHHDSLLDDWNPEQLEDLKSQRLVEDQVAERQDDFRSERQKTREESRQKADLRKVVNRRLFRGDFPGGRLGKGVLPVSQAPGIGAITEGDELSEPFTNQSQVHADYVVDELQ